MRYSFIITIICLIGSTIYAQTNPHWETLIETGDNCKYYIPNSEISATWKQSSFNDGSWTQGISGIGYEDGDDNTTIATGVNSVYMRFSFTIADISIISGLVLDADYDDGFVAYLNGTEIARANVDDPISWNMDLSVDHEATMYNGQLPERFFIPTTTWQGLLVNGQNILAIEVHNVSAASSDLSSNFFLHVKVNSSAIIYGETPDWFWKPVDFSSFNLPLMIINTNGQTIPNEPKITVDMILLDYGPEKENTPDDEPNLYNGPIGIEIRGESAQMFEKKTYSIELRHFDGTSNNVSLLGLPEENDFVLYGPYSDKTMIKNVLSYNLYRKMGSWAPRVRYIELILNDNYRGIYVLTEKIKRDRNRVNISLMDSTDLVEPGITGGYILRRDKTTSKQPYQYWTSTANQIYFEQMVYQYYYPEYWELTEAQRTYIQNWMYNFDELMSDSHFDHPTYGYPSVINVKSFVDYLILSEFNKGVDNYVYSNYFYKQNDIEGGKLVAGPPWDYNIAFGNLNYGFEENIPYSYDWMYTHWGRTYWFNRLMEDPEFAEEVYCSWELYRKTMLNTQSIDNVIDSCINVMGEAIDRNYERFKILGTWVWPNLTYPATYEEEITDLKNWIYERLDWIDDQWKKCPYDPNSTETIPFASQINVFPNPSDFSNLKISIDTQIDENYTIELCDLYGRIIERIVINDSITGTHVYKFKDHSSLPDGLYICKIQSKNSGIYSFKIIKR